MPSRFQLMPSLMADDASYYAAMMPCFFHVELSPPIALIYLSS